MSVALPQVRHHEQVLGLETEWAAVVLRAGFVHVRPADGQRGEGRPVPRQELRDWLLQLADRLPVFRQLYHNTPEQAPSDYQNTPAAVAISLLAKQNDSQAANEYSQSHAAAQSEESDLDFVSTEEEVLKLTDKQWNEKSANLDWQWIKKSQALLFSFCKSLVWV